MHAYITVSPVQYFVQLNSCVIRYLATSMTFDAPHKRPVHFGKTIAKYRSSGGVVEVYSFFSGAPHSASPLP